MAVPKRHLSKARRDKRRSNVWKLEAPALVKCSNCGSLKLPPPGMWQLRLLQGRGSHQEGLICAELVAHWCYVQKGRAQCLPLLALS